MKEVRAVTELGELGELGEKCLGTPEIGIAGINVKAEL
jgi:hypothetical protein